LNAGYFSYYRHVRSIENKNSRVVNSTPRVVVNRNRRWRAVGTCTGN